MATISLIIPVYNTEKGKLRRCFDSIYHHQTYRDFEVLVIDDGSDDGCADYLSICQKSYGFCLVRQSNQGVSAARNYGMALSSGDYIMFVDSDDSLEAECLSRIVALIAESNADMILGGINMIEKGGTQKCAISGEKVITYVGKDVQKLQRYMLAIQCEADSKELSGLRCSGPWAKAIKKEVLKTLEFDTQLPVYEDLFFNLSMLDYTQTLVIDTAVWYNYFVYNDSAMHKFRENGIQEQKAVMKRLMAFKEDHGERFGAAVALKTVESLRRMFRGTIFFTKEHPLKKIHTVREVLKDDVVCELLSDMDEKQYPSKTWKEKVLRFSMAKKSVFIVSLYYLFMCN
ncbi:MAG: glycosyltransferase [Clostridiales bacterium]|nr:glycosyltransferase [Clostridiales bacterium]